MKKIVVIGAGKIGSAILRAAIKSGLVRKEQAMASDVSESLRQSAAKELGVKVTPSNGVLCDFADIVIGEVRQTEPLSAESNDASTLHLHRLVMRFNREDYARLRQMIDVINSG